MRKRLLFVGLLACFVIVFVSGLVSAELPDDCDKTYLGSEYNDVEAVNLLKDVSNNINHVCVDGNVEGSVGAAMNGGKITINGNAGWTVGDRMAGGIITVDGNADDVGQDMQTGIITVTGSVEGGVGRRMQNGAITITGNVKGDVGSAIKDGTITVNGNVGRDVGRNMQNGAITITGNVRGYVGDSFMSGGLIKIIGDGSGSGNVGKGVGLQMVGGIIEVDGNVKGEIGYEMKGGDINIGGFVVLKSNSIGERMENGNIVIGKDVLGFGVLIPDYIGSGMKSGTINIGGSVLDSGGVGVLMKGGNINVGGCVQNYVEDSLNVNARLCKEMYVDGLFFNTIHHRCVAIKTKINGDLSFYEGHVLSGFDFSPLTSPPIDIEVKLSPSPVFREKCYNNELYELFLDMNFIEEVEYLARLVEIVGRNK